MSERILAVDCSNRWTSVGIMDDGALVVETNLDLGRSQAARLPLIVQEALRKAHWSLEDLSAVAVTVGPGYFTGIRIAMAYCMALADGLSVPVIPVSSLAALVWSDSPNGGLLVPCIRAGEGKVYCAGFRRASGQLSLVLQEGERSIDELRSVLSGFDGPLLLRCTEDRTLPEPGVFGDSVDIERVCCIGALSVAATAWSHRETATSPENLRARYYRAPGLGAHGSSR
ncbi:MAG: tRNA (adenosine(37)-N6)-threonylcarbamoyltransferase complex dimerization subunit type 1 TsaB [Dethiosulfovibrio peptidovorans]|nr:MAG: tRNA (adenosine(37)-N6)-threonylcarbamoyltransferase complex dimerization subunit type 1 TsaB [Dethiosulfovibrio peptidovorans]